jgi:hypothetical protein
MFTPDEDRALHALRDAAGLWLTAPRERGYEAGVIMAAAEALAQGADTPSLRELAGISTHRISLWSLTEFARAAFEELGLHLPEPRSAEAQTMAMKAMCRQLSNGLVTPRTLTDWAHRHIGHDGPAALQDLVELDDEYDIQGQSEDLDRRTASAAEALLRGDTSR